MLDTDHRCHLHARVADRGIFQVNRADPLTTGLDHVLRSIANLHHTIGCNHRDIAGGEPAVHQRRCVALEIALQDPLPAHHQLALRAAIARQGGAGVVDHLDLDAKNALALFGNQRVTLLGRPVGLLLRSDHAHRCDRRGLGHPPAVANVDAVLIVELRDQSKRHGRAAGGGASHRREAQAVLVEVGDQALPDGGHACAHGDLLGFHQLVKRRTIQLGARQYQFGAGDQRRIRQAPGIDVKHRYDRQDGFLRRQAQRAREADGDRIEHDRPVRIERALGIAGGAGGVAQRRSGALIKAWPVKVVACRRDEVLVVEDVGDTLDGGSVGRVGEAHPVAHPGAMRCDAFDDRRKACVEDDGFVFGVVDDVDQLLRVQARIAGVHHHAAARYRVIGLEVAVVVPGDRGDRAAGGEAQASQCIGKLSCPHRALTGRVAKERAVGLTRNDFGVAVLSRRVFDDAGKQQRHVHHQTGLKHVGGFLRK